MKNKTTFYISMRVILICAAIIVMVAIKQWYLLIGFLIGLASSIKETSSIKGKNSNEN